MKVATILALVVAGVSARPAYTLPLEVRDAAAVSTDSDITSTLIAAAAYSWSVGAHTTWRKPKTCSLADARLPTTSNDTLPKPTTPLAQVLLGRGVQNYTCDASKPDAAPAAIGALATLYDASCVAARLGPFLPYLPMLALVSPNPAQTDDSDFYNMELLGHHYFLDPKSPVFNLNTVNGKKGYSQVAKVASIDAPKNAMAGKNGAVGWLYLTRNKNVTATADEPTFGNVYRVNTAGGNPPKTCQGQPASFSVDYAAEYWLYE